MTLFKKKEPPYERRPVKKLTKELLEKDPVVPFGFNDYLNFKKMFRKDTDQLVVYLLLDIIERLERLEKTYNTDNRADNTDN